MKYPKFPYSSKKLDKGIYLNTAQISSDLEINCIFIHFL